MKKRQQFTALGANIFAGLFTVGVQRAGFQILGHLEHGPYGTKTARLNFPDLDIRIGTHAWQPEDYKGKVDFMYTNPACSAWSGMRHGSIKTTWEAETGKLQCIRDLVDAALVIRPRAWCWESVMGAWRIGRSFVLEQAEIFCRNGYDVTILLQNNKYLGGAQERERCLIIAHRHPLVWPALTEPRTMRQTLRKVPRRKTWPNAPDPYQLGPLHQELWKRSADFNGRISAAFKAMTDQERIKFKGPTPLDVFRRLDFDKPFPVMLQADRRLHPTECRVLHWGEWLAACDLPFDWKTGCGGYTGATVELAKGVMPPVGEWLGRAVAVGLALPARPRGRAVVRDIRKPADIREEVLWSSMVRQRTEAEWCPAPPPVKLTRIPKSGDVRPQARGQGIGAFMRERLAAGDSTEQCLAATRAKFPTSKASESDVAWNRRKLRQLQSQG